MATEKCNLQILSNLKEKPINDLTISLFGQQINLVDTSTFLGIRFDNRLSLTEQVKHVESICVNRLSLLKNLILQALEDKPPTPTLRLHEPSEIGHRIYGYNRSALNQRER